MGTLLVKDLTMLMYLEWIMSKTNSNLADTKLETIGLLGYKL